MNCTVILTCMAPIMANKSSWCSKWARWIANVAFKRLCVYFPFHHFNQMNGHFLQKKYTDFSKYFLRDSLNFKRQSWSEILYICQSQHTYHILYHVICIYNMFQPQGPSSGTTTKINRASYFANTFKKTRMAPHFFTKDFCLIFLWFFSNILTWSICDYAEVM